MKKTKKITLIVSSVLGTIGVCSLSPIILTSCNSQKQESIKTQNDSESKKEFNKANAESLYNSISSTFGLNQNKTLSEVRNEFNSKESLNSIKQKLNLNTDVESVQFPNPYTIMICLNAPAYQDGEHNINGKNVKITDKTITLTSNQELFIDNQSNSNEQTLRNIYDKLDETLNISSQKIVESNAYNRFLREGIDEQIKQVIDDQNIKYVSLAIQDKKCFCIQTHFTKHYDDQELQISYKNADIYYIIQGSKKSSSTNAKIYFNFKKLPNEINDGFFKDTNNKTSPVLDWTKRNLDIPAAKFLYSYLDKDECFTAKRLNMKTAKYFLNNLTYYNKYLEGLNLNYSRIMKTNVLDCATITYDLKNPVNLSGEVTIYDNIKIKVYGNQITIINEEDNLIKDGITNSISQEFINKLYDALNIDYKIESRRLFISKVNSEFKTPNIDSVFEHNDIRYINKFTYIDGITFKFDTLFPKATIRYKSVIFEFNHKTIVVHPDFGILPNGFFLPDIREFNNAHHLYVTLYHYLRLDRTLPFTEAKRILDSKRPWGEIKRSLSNNTINYVYIKSIDLKNTSIKINLDTNIFLPKTFVDPEIPDCTFTITPNSVSISNPNGFFNVNDTKYNFSTLDAEHLIRILNDFVSLNGAYNQYEVLESLKNKDLINTIYSDFQLFLPPTKIDLLNTKTIKINLAEPVFNETQFKIWGHKITVQQQSITIEFENDICRPDYDFGSEKFAHHVYDKINELLKIETQELTVNQAHQILMNLNSNDFNQIIKDPYIKILGIQITRNHWIRILTNNSNYNGGTYFYKNAYIAINRNKITIYHYDTSNTTDFFLK